MTSPWSPRPGNVHVQSPPVPGCSPFPKPLLRSSEAFGSGPLPQVPEHPPQPASLRDVAGPRPILGARPRPRPQQAARLVTHLLARLGHRVVAGCRAGCSCHGVGQILGRSIRLGVIHHLRTTHGSRGSGGPRAAAAAPHARATGAADAASVAAPAATAAKAGPPRPPARRGARAREGLAISGGPGTGTFIFSPPVSPSRAYTASRGGSGPRRGRMTAPGSAEGSGAPRRASRSRSLRPGRQPWGAAALVCIYTMHAGARPITSARAWARTGAGAGGGEALAGGGALRLPGLCAVPCKVSPTRTAVGGVAQQGDPGEGRQRIGAKLEGLSASQQ